MSAIARTTFNLPSNFGISVTFRCRGVGQTCRRLKTGPYSLRCHQPRMSVTQVIILHPCTKFEVQRSPLRHIWHIFCLSVNQPAYHDWKRGHGLGSSMSWCTFLPTFSLLSSSILDQGSGTGQTDGQTTATNALCPLVVSVAVAVPLAVPLASWGTTAATRVPRLRIGERPREWTRG